MKTKRIPLYIWVTGILTAFSVAFSVLVLTQNTEADSPQTSVMETSYLLKDYQGKIALYRNGETSPEKIYDIYLSTLPELDQQHLKIGISLRDEAELERLLEDFDS